MKVFNTKDIAAVVGRTPTQINWAAKQLATKLPEWYYGRYMGGYWIVDENLMGKIIMNTAPTLSTANNWCDQIKQRITMEISDDYIS